MKKFYLALLSAFLAFGSSVADVTNYWFGFGPEAVNCAQSAKCYIEVASIKHEIILTDKNALSQLKSFIIENLYENANRVPPVSEPEKSDCYNAIVLFEDDSASKDKMLMYIPISNDATGDDWQQVLSAYETLINRFILLNQTFKTSTTSLSPLRAFGNDSTRRNINKNWFVFGSGLFDCAKSASCFYAENTSSEMKMENINFTNSEGLSKLKSFLK